MKRVFDLVFVLFIGTLILISGNAEAWEIDFQPRLEGGISHYTFESEVNNAIFLSLPVSWNSGLNTTQESFEFSDYLPFVSYGGTVFLNRFYLDFTGQQSGNGKDSTTIALSGYVDGDIDLEHGYLETSFIDSNRAYDASFNRGERALSLGYAVTKRFNIYAGYKWAGTEFNTSYLGVYGIRRYDYATPLSYFAGKLWGEVDYRFNYEGPFLGGLYGWTIDSGGILSGVLTASLALAHLNGKVTLDRSHGYFSITEINGQKTPEDFEPIEGDGMTLRFDAKGETLGATIGLAWRGWTGIQGLSYYLGVNGYRYEFDAEDNRQSDINETAVAYRVGISYLF